MKKKCIKPNCGYVYDEKEEEFYDEICQCGCRLEIIQSYSEKVVDQTSSSVPDNDDTGKFVGISADGSLIIRKSSDIEENVESGAKYLDIYNKGDIYKTYCIKYDETVIGRSCIDSIPDIDLNNIDPNKNISRRHALIYRIRNQYYIKNLSSKNSLHVNNEPVPYNNSVKLEDESEIVLSNFIGIVFYDGYLESDINE